MRPWPVIGAAFPSLPCVCGRVAFRARVLRVLEAEVDEPIGTRIASEHPILNGVSFKCEGSVANARKRANSATQHLFGKKFLLYTPAKERNYQVDLQLRKLKECP